MEEVPPAEGWEHEVVTDGGSEAEVSFTGEGGEQVDLRVALDDDGLPVAEVCSPEQ